MLSTLAVSAGIGRLLDDGCRRCHPPPRYTDRWSYDVGTQGPRDQRRRFDTPTLIEFVLSL